MNAQERDDTMVDANQGRKLQDRINFLSRKTYLLALQNGTPNMQTSHIDMNKIFALQAFADCKPTRNRDLSRRGETREVKGDPEITSLRDKGSKPSTPQQGEIRGLLLSSLPESKQRIATTSHDVRPQGAIFSSFFPRLYRAIYTSIFYSSHESKYAPISAYCIWHTN